MHVTGTPKVVHITEHAYERGRERLGLSKQAITKIANRAFLHGRKHSDFAGELRKYINRLYLQKGTANNIRIYGEHVYVFVDATLVTIIPVPPELRSKLRRLPKES